MNSVFDKPVEPSTIFKETESAALLIWLDREYNSCFGNVSATLSTSSANSKVLAKPLNFQT